MNVNKAIFCGSKLGQSGQKIHPFGVKEITATRNNFVNKKAFRTTAQVKYPLAKNIPLPNNVEAIMSVEIGQFSPQRYRDISSPIIYSKSHDSFGQHQSVLSKTFNQFVESYDCKGAVSLNSSMQSNVPIPFKSRGNVTNLNMPGGQWEQGAKFISEDMQKLHYLQHIKNKKQGIRLFHTLTNQNSSSSVCSVMLRRLESTKTNGQLSRKEQLKRAVAEYGTTVIVFHVGISLVSLGAFYTLVSSGLDMDKFISYIPWIDTSTSLITKNAGTFVTAYAIHKVFAPIRISITLTSVPFIVRYLRSIGFLKKRT